MLVRHREVGGSYIGFTLSGPRRGAFEVFKRLPAFMRPQQIKVIEAVPVNGRVLDFGCGTGRLLEKLQMWRRDIEYVGVDIEDYWRLRGAGEKVDGITLVKVAPTMDLPFPPESFDAIYCTQVLEHLPDPSRFFAEMKRNLKVGGVLLVETPSVRSMFVPSLRWVHRLNRVREHVTMNFYDDPTHIRPFTRQSLFRLADATGLRVMGCGKVHNILNLCAAPMHLLSFVRGQISGLVYWWADLLGCINYVRACRES